VARFTIEKRRSIESVLNPEVGVMPIFLFCVRVNLTIITEK
jgi:hypothetical protein